MNAVALMARLFPDPQDAALPEHGQYSAVLSVRLEALEKTAVAAASKPPAGKTPPSKPTVTAAKVENRAGSANECDRLAAHPADRGRPEGVEGIADEAVNAAQAI